MAGEDLLEGDDGGSNDTSGGGKKGKHKPLSKGQKIGLAIGVVTILLIIYQVRKQNAANAAASGSAASAATDPLTGYPAGSAEDQAALAAMYGQSAPSSGSSSGGTDTTGGVTGTAPTTGQTTTPSGWNTLLPGWGETPGWGTSSPQPSPSVQVATPPATVAPVSTTPIGPGASTTSDLENQLATLTSEFGLKPVTTAEIPTTGGTYVGLGGTAGISKAKAAGQTIVGGSSVPGGNPKANYIYVKS